MFGYRHPWVHFVKPVWVFGGRGEEGVMNTPVEQHEMEHRGTLPSGAQEWACPTCSRHFIVRWPPNYQRIVLEEGDANAVHVGGNGTVQLGGPADPARPSAAAENAWRGWLAERGMTWDDDQVA
jgi:hypothetical protein